MATEHVVESALLKSKLINYENGSYAGGQCKNQKQNNAVTYRRQRDRATQFAKEIQYGSLDPKTYNTSTAFIDPTSSHKAPKRSGLSFHDDPEELSETSSSDDQCTGKSRRHKIAKPAFRKRVKRSLVFQKSLEMAKKTKALQLMNIHNAGDCKNVFELRHNGKIRLVEIGETPNCDCGMVSTNDICMHVIWVMIIHLGVNEHDEILHQKSIPPSRIRKMLRTSTVTTTTPQQINSDKTSDNVDYDI